MTREEKMKEINIRYKNKILFTKANLKQLINEIYDDFENRKCKYCKYALYTPSGKIVCTNDNPITSKIILDIYEDYGCNNFKRREK